MNQTISAVQSAIKAKAPVVAIPVEGHAPFCLPSKLLKGALKGVKIHSAEVERIENEQFILPERIHVSAHYNESTQEWVRSEMVQPEGPSERKVSVSFALRIKGMDGFVRTSCRIVPMPRHEALKQLSAWAEKEREKQAKQRILPTGKAGSERIKLAKYITTHIDSDDAQTFFCRKPDKNTYQVKGMPIALKAWPEMRFFVHSSESDGNRYDWRVTEASSGMGVTSGHNSPLKAIEAAELAVSKGNKQVALAKIAELQIAEQVAA